MNLSNYFKGYAKMTLKQKASKIAGLIVLRSKELGHHDLDRITIDLFDWLHDDEREDY